jgi:hypothetical protein
MSKPIAIPQNARMWHPEEIFAPCEKALNDWVKEVEQEFSFIALQKVVFNALKLNSKSLLDLGKASYGDRIVNNVFGDASEAVAKETMRFLETKELRQDVVRKHTNWLQGLKGSPSREEAIAKIEEWVLGETEESLSFWADEAIRYAAAEEVALEIIDLGWLDSSMLNFFQHELKGAGQGKEGGAFHLYGNAWFRGQREPMWLDQEKLRERMERAALRFGLGGAPFKKAEKRKAL